MGQSKPNARLRWEKLPLAVRDDIEAVLGSPVVGAVSQAGGFSPGTADRLTAADGRRAFAKAIRRGMNEVSFSLFEQEAQVAEALSELELPAPALLGRIERGDWIALVFEDVDGREPTAAESDIAAVFDALRRLPILPAESELRRDDRRAETRVARWGADWAAGLQEGVLDTLPPIAAAHLDEMLMLARRAPDAVRGEYLVHMDIRPDNIVLDRSGTAWLVDWPWAVVGAPWVDALSYLLGLAVTEPPCVVERWTAVAPLAAAAADDIDAVMAAVCGNLFRNAIQPPPPALVGLREFQREFAARWSGSSSAAGGNSREPRMTHDREDPRAESLLPILHSGSSVPRRTADKTPRGTPDS